MEKQSVFSKIKDKIKAIGFKINRFLVLNWPSKRRLIQIYAMLLYNANMKGFVTGDIFVGKTKEFCLPGMNCYSCPGAIGACPLGSIQNALAESKTKAPTYVLGIILLYCIIFGRWICGWLCPGGLLQELLYKIKTPKLKKNRITRALSYFKYVLLVVLVIIIPIMYGVIQNLPLPAFCKYVCPIGTFEGGVLLLANGNNATFFAQLGPLFTWKFAILVGFIVGSIFIYRFFCRFFCPLGALYGIFNKLSIIGVKVDKTKCNHCGACVSNCKMDVMEVGDHECIQCGECIKTCHACAISWKTIKSKVEADLALENATISNPQVIEENNENDDRTEIEKIVSGNLKVSNDSETKVIDEDNENSSYAEEESLVLKDASKENGFVSFFKKIGNKISQNKLVSIVTTCMLAILTCAILYACVWSVENIISVNGVVNKVEVNLYDDASSDEHCNLTNIYANNTDTIVLYFYDEFNLIEIQNASKAYDHGAKVYAISSFKNHEENYKTIVENATNINMDSISFAYDSEKSTAIKTFVTEATYPYYIWSDKKNSVKYSSNENIEGQLSLISSAVAGKELGFNVGEMCYGSDIKLVNKKGKETGEVFNVLNNTGKISVINFWGYWCTPCKEELPGFINVYNSIKSKYGDVIDMVAIHQGTTYLTDYDLEEASDYMSDLDAPIKWGHDDENDSYFKMLGGTSIYPITLVIDGDGIVRLNRTGKLQEAELERIIEEIISSSK